MIAMPRHVPAPNAVTLRRVAALYEGGLSIRDTAARCGWSYGLTHKLLHQAHAAGMLVAIRPRGHSAAGRATQER